MTRKHLRTGAVSYTYGQGLVLHKGFVQRWEEYAEIYHGIGSGDDELPLYSV